MTDGLDDETPGDDVTIEIDHDEDGVTITFGDDDGEPRYAVLTPDQARTIAESLMRHADEAEGY